MSTEYRDRTLIDKPMLGECRRVELFSTQAVRAIAAIDKVRKALMVERDEQCRRVTIVRVLQGFESEMVECVCVWWNVCYCTQVSRKCRAYMIIWNL